MANIIIDKIGFEGLEEKNGKIYYTTDKLKVYFNIDRTGTVDYTNPKVRVAIYSGSDIIGDTGFLDSSNSEKGYEGGLSTYPTGWANCTIKKYLPITSVLVELQVKIGSSKLSGQIDISTVKIYDSLSKGNKVGQLIGENIENILPLNEYEEIIKDNILPFSIKGISNQISNYSNSKYYMRDIQLIIPKIKYYSYEGFPEKCVLTAINPLNNEEEIIAQITKPSKQKNIYTLNKNYNQFYLTVEYQNAIKIYSTNLQCFSDFLNLENKININSNFIQPNKVTEFNEQEYKQIIYLQGKISIDDNEFPYQINSAHTFSLKTDTHEQTLFPSILSSGWKFDEGIDFGSKENNNITNRQVSISFSIKNYFTGQFETVNLQIKEKYFNYYENLKILPDLLKISILNSDNRVIENCLIANKEEIIKIEYDKTKIFAPHLRRFLQEDDSYDIEYELYTDRYETTDGLFSYSEPLTLSNSIITYENLYKVYNEEEHYENEYIPSQTTLFQNLFVKVKMKQGDIILENEINPDDVQLKSIQLGRTIQPILSSCYLRENLLIFQLSEYGGDKNDTLTEFDFYKNTYSSLYRGIGEKLKLILYIENEEQKIYEYSIPNNLFWKENSNIEINLEDLEIDCSKIKQIDFYYYCFLDEEKSLFFTTEGFEIEYSSPRPNIGHRKNGFIINGTPGQSLPEDEFIQINCLNTEKCIALYSPEVDENGKNIVAKIHFKNGKIYLSGFEIGEPPTE